MSDPFATLNQLRAYVHEPIPDPEPDPPDETTVVLTLALDAATDAIKVATNRTFEVVGESAEARFFTHPHRFSEEVPLPIGANPFSQFFFYPFQNPWLWHQPHVAVDDFFLGDVQGIGDITIADRASGFLYTPDRGYPFNAASKGKPFEVVYVKNNGALPIGAGEIVVTAKWGWPAIPTTIVNATLLQAARFWKRRDAPFGVAGVDAMGNAMRVSRLDPDIDKMISRYRRWRGQVV